MSYETDTYSREPLDLFNDKLWREGNMRDIDNFTKEWIPLGYKIFLLVDVHFFSKLGQPAPADVEVIYLHNVMEVLATVDPTNTLIIYALEHAQDGLPIIDYLTKNKIKYASVGCVYTGGYVYDDRVCRFTIEDSYVNQTKDGYAKFDDPGSSEDFVNLCQALYYTDHLIGDVVEIGCFRGSSGSNMLDYAHNKKLQPKKFYFLDVFEGFTYEDAYTSSDVIWKDTHQTEGEEIIRHRLESKAHNNQVIVKKVNIISDPLPPELHRITVANIDVDLYEAVSVALNRISKLMVVGGIMICEDAGHTPGLIGARLALEQFIRSDRGKDFTPVHMTSGQVFLIRHI